MITDNPSKTTSHEQKLSGDAIVNRYTLIAAGFGVVPSPTINSVGIAVMELVMIDELARNYAFPYPTKLAAAKAFISLVGSLGPVYVAVKSKSAISAVPIVGHLISSVIYSITGAISVYAVGKIFQRHFESGGKTLSMDNSYLRSLFQQEAENGAKQISLLATDT